MIIWSGRGFLSVVVLFIIGVAGAVVLPEEYSGEATSVAFLGSGVFSWIMGRKWNGTEARMYTDQKTGQEVAVKPNHTLFWIKMQYIGIGFIAIGIFRIVMGLVV